MRHISLVLVFTLICCLFPALPAVPAMPAVSAEGTEYSPNYVLEDFANGVVPQGSHSITVSYTEQGAGYASGAAHVIEKGNYQTIKYPFGARKGQTYDISVWIKMDETSLNSAVSFIIYSQRIDGETGDNVYNSVTVSDAGLAKDKWVKVSAAYTHSGTGRKVGDKTEYETLPIGYIQVRIGNGKASETCSSGTVAYTIDDVTVMPRESIQTPLSEDNLIVNGDFEAESFADGWIWNESLTSVEQSEGVNGTNTAVSISVKKNWGTIYQDNVDVRFGRAYKVSYWAKALSEEAVGLEICTILSRNNGKIDEHIPDYEYLLDGEDATLSTEWKYYETIYSNDMCTTDTVMPNVRFRVGKGTEQITYVVDELKVEEIESEGLLSSTASIEGDAAYGSIYGYVSALNGLTMGCVYRLMIPFGGDYAILRSGSEKHNEFIVYPTDEVSFSSLVVRAQSMDYDGNVGAEYIKIYNSAEFDVRITAEFNETIWNDDIPSVSAGVTFNGTNKPTDFLAVIAGYSQDGKLLAVNSKKIPVANGASGIENIKISNSKDIKSAKVFLWNEENANPVQPAAEAEKNTGGIYFYVDPTAAQNGDGSYAAPYNSIENAVAAAGGYAQQKGNNIYVICKPGEYYIDDTLNLPSTQFNGNNNITFTSYSRIDKAQFTGGQKITGFSLYNSNKNIYRAKAPDGAASRQLFVDGVRAQKARSIAGLSDAANIKKLANGTYVTAEEYEILKETDSSLNASAIGIRTTDTFLKDYKRINDIELVFYEQWTSPRCQVSSIVDNDDGTVLLVMDQRGWTYMSNKGSTSVSVPVYIENAIELLDEEGEWYYDSVDGYVYYKPRFFENMSTAEVVMPVTEKLLTLSGTENRNIKNVTFDSIEFTETTWMRPSTTAGHSDVQNNHLRERPDVGIDILSDAAIEVTYADNVDFTNCNFNRIGTTALKMIGGVKNCDVVGNEFYELSAGGINLGEPAGDVAKVINPTDKRYLITNNNITDNYIHKYGVDYMSAAGISAGFVKNTNIANNEIFDSAYSGMHIGYGWATYDATGTATNNLHIKNNYIHNVMNDNLFDGGAIYTNGATGGTADKPNLICGNYIEDVGNFPGAIYPDEGSTFWKISENVIDLSMHTEWTGKFGSMSRVPSWLHIWTNSIHDIVLENNYSTTKKYKNAGRNITFAEAILPLETGWQDEALKIIEASGIRKEKQINYKYGLQTVTVPEEITLRVGESMKNIPLCYTSKKTPYYSSGVSIYEKNHNSNIAQSENCIITAKAAGETYVTYCLVENGIMTEVTTKIIVTD